MEPIDDTIVDRSTYPAEYKDKDVFVDAVGAVILGYRTDVYPNGSQPKGWKEFWDLKKFPGPRAMRNHPSGNLEFALIGRAACPTPTSSIRPDVERALKKLDEIKSDIIVWWESGAQAVQLILDKEVNFVTVWNGRFTDVLRKDPSAPVAIEWTEAMAIIGTYVIPQGSQGRLLGPACAGGDGATGASGDLRGRIPYPTPNPEMLKHLDPALLPSMPSAPQNMSKMFLSNYEWWDEHAAATLERWNASILG